MPSVHSIADFLSVELQLDAWPGDGAVNGLQFEGCTEVSTVAMTVDASLQTISEAAAQGAQLLVAHHGLLWGKPLPFIGAQKTLISALVRSDLSVYGAHLPLDGHPSWGNNALLSGMLGLSNARPCLPYGGRDIAFIGNNQSGRSREETAALLFQSLGASYRPLSLSFGPAVPESILVVSGAGSDALLEHRKLGFDTLVTGEPRQFAYHYARENGLNVIFAGHYATETVGVKKLGGILASRFGVKNLFIDCPTGI